MPRTRYRYDEATKQMVEVGSDWTDAERRALTPTEELVYGTARGPAGEDLSSRKKHREFLQRTGLALVDDFKETSARAAAQRNDRTAERREIRETVGRTLYQLSTQRKRR